MLGWVFLEEANQEDLWLSVSMKRTGGDLWTSAFLLILYYCNYNLFTNRRSSILSIT
jgi:hypothetical protein